MIQTKIQPPELLEPVVRHANVSPAVGHTMLIPGTICGKDTLMVVDTAAQISMISQPFFDSLNHHTALPPELIGIKNAEHGSHMQCHLTRQLSLTIDNKQFKVDVAVGPITDHFILGLDFLLEHHCVVDIDSCTVTIDGSPISAVMKKGSGTYYHVSRILTTGRTVIPPKHRINISVTLTNPAHSDYVTTPEVTDALIIPSCIIVGGNGPVIMEVINDSNETVTLRPAREIAQAIELGEVLHTEPIRLEASVYRTGIADRMKDQDMPTLEEVDELNKSSLPLATTFIPDPNLDETFINAKLKEVKSQIPSHLVDVLDRAKTNISLRQQIALGLLLIQFADSFAKNSKDLGKLSLMRHRIHTYNEDPVRERLRRTPLKFQDEEERTLTDMLDAHVIKPSTSEWASAPVLVRKKDGEVRYTVDYRKLNAMTIKDAYPMPLIEECMDTLSGTLWFHTLDLASGYWQIEVDERDRHKTAFLTKFGLFEHVRMAQGLCNAPATFQRVMHLVMRGLTWDRVLVYLDDVIVLGRSFEESLENLELVLMRFKAHNLKLKPKKCALFCTEVRFLGRQVSRNGVAVTTDHVKCVQDWPHPKNALEVSKFTGFVNYHREFIPRLAETIKPLYALTKRGEVFEWTGACENAFQELKRVMTTTPVLAFPNNEDQFTLDTDASDFAIGAALYQLQDGSERPISFASHTLTPVQQRYCTTRKELLAVVVFTRHYRHYLLGREFILRTDHGSLTWLFRFKNPIGQLGRWLEELSQYSMIIQHRAGTKHSNADGLSRIPEELDSCNCYEAGKDVNSLPCGGCPYCIKLHMQWSRFEEEVDYVVPLVVRQLSGSERTDTLLEAADRNQSDQSYMDQYSPQELRSSQLLDDELLPVIRWLEDESSTDNDLELLAVNTRILWKCRDQLQIKNGVLYYRWEEDIGPPTLKLVVPRTLRQEALRLTHDNRIGGHWSRDKTYSKLRKSFYWPSMHRDCRLFVETCATCHVNKTGRSQRAPLLHYQAGTPGSGCTWTFWAHSQRVTQGTNMFS